MRMMTKVTKLSRELQKRLVKMKKAKLPRIVETTQKNRC